MDVLNDKNADALKLKPCTLPTARIQEIISAIKEVVSEKVSIGTNPRDSIETVTRFLTILNNYADKVGAYTA